MITESQLIHKSIEDHDSDAQRELTSKIRKKPVGKSDPKSQEAEKANMIGPILKPRWDVCPELPPSEPLLYTSLVPAAKSAKFLESALRTLFKVPNQPRIIVHHTSPPRTRPPHPPYRCTHPVHHTHIKTPGPFLGVANAVSRKSNTLDGCLELVSAKRNCSQSGLCG
eukprot:Blabericola_migrator_1__13300@NODE_931_length_5994_cov_125_451324_g647_i0_p5_GENE_NODE_931_length_5994_cov_125_451324_g647_i0NODE_931_length_5994_cov_125_451324_g647_i0_p5_ORF_typecomplete_len168_score23_23_NODE_931_length_5994_cov_125_451324_g647_i038754378